MTRYPDWQTRLQSFLSGVSAAGFQYGTLDCCLFVADAILAMTGTDLAAPFRGKYRTRAKATKALQEYSGRKTVAATVRQIAAAHQMPMVPVSRAQRGDMVLVDRPGDASMGLVSLNGRDILALSSKELLRLPIHRGHCAWRV